MEPSYFKMLCYQIPCISINLFTKFHLKTILVFRRINLDFSYVSILYKFVSPNITNNNRFPLASFFITGISIDAMLYVPLNVL